MPLVTQIAPYIKATKTTAADLVTATQPMDLRTVYDWASGTGANQADLIYSDTRTTDATGETLDLDGLTDAFGVAVAFARIKMMLIRAAAGNTLNVLVGGGDWATWVANSSDITVVRPGGLMLFVAPDVTGYAVTASTGDGLLIKASTTGNVTYDIVLIGASA